MDRLQRIVHALAALLRKLRRIGRNARDFVRMRGVLSNGVCEFLHFGCGHLQRNRSALGPDRQVGIALGHLSGRQCKFSRTVADIAHDQLEARTRQVERADQRRERARNPLFKLASKITRSNTVEIVADMPDRSKHIARNGAYVVTGQQRSTGKGTPTDCQGD